MLSLGVALGLLPGRMETRAPYDTRFLPCRLCSKCTHLIACGGLSSVVIFGGPRVCVWRVLLGLGLGGVGLGFGGVLVGRVVLLAEVRFLARIAASNRCRVHQFFFAPAGLSQRDRPRQKRLQRPRRKPRPNFSKPPLRGHVF